MSKDAIIQFQEGGACPPERGESGSELEPRPRCESWKSSKSKDAIIQFREGGGSPESCPPDSHAAQHGEGDQVSQSDAEARECKVPFPKTTGQDFDNHLNVCRVKLQGKMKVRLQDIFQGITQDGEPAPLTEIYTELLMTEGGTVEAGEKHEVGQIEAALRKVVTAETTITQENLFRPRPEGEHPVRTVMTKGVAGIGKTVLTQKFTLDWAEDKAHQDIHFTFPFTFRELNVLKEKFSLVEFIHHFFIEIKDAGICSFEDLQVLFIFDGLDECRLPMDFSDTKTLSDITTPASVGELLTNLIRGNLLPSARLWITTRPGAAKQIPAESVDLVTEIQGFNNQQKEEYFRKRFRDEEQAKTIISHIKNSRSLHVMCHIPVFCWITATVLENKLNTGEGGELPQSLTEMYIHFLVVQAKAKKLKYGEDSERDSECEKMIKSLGKLAFDQLQNGNLIFYESDLKDCDINAEEASTYSGVFTLIFREEKGLFQERVFCFVHLSVQEFLAALHVHATFVRSGINLMEEQQANTGDRKLVQRQFYQSAINKALQSPNGHLDLFLRFLLGLSLEPNQYLLQGLVTRAKSITCVSEETCEYIKMKIRKGLPADKSINLFHCLNELNDRSLVEEIQTYLRSGCLSRDHLSPGQWSALVFILLLSDDLEVFDLKKYPTSEDALLRLLPVVEASKKALLSNSNLSRRSCEALSSVLSSRSSNLRDLDMSNNDLQDSGVEVLCDGLRSQQCELETLRLSGCLITEAGCASLASALRSNPSHLRTLDLSYNHPGGAAVELSKGKENSHWRLEMLRIEPAGDKWLKPGKRKYYRPLTIDTNTASRRLQVSEDRRVATFVTDVQPYSDHPDRFDDQWSNQLLCTEVLSGRCYWEVEWRGRVEVAVSYRGIGRRGDKNNCRFGKSRQSWCLICFDWDSYCVRHDNKETLITFTPSSSSSAESHRAAVYVDYRAGSLSFFRVSDSPMHIYTFDTTFTEAPYPGFELREGSSLSLC
ncbi:NLR family CARD domain-containing protein 3 isoform X2 [Oryzias melastigma]|uniref:NLR family CARD domain-containing protein 3 isoform X2 n=1 Tax=Oryzias melastigma TaxID=30732 RepID=UPI00168D1ADD|nr:NLR family CARD domain-containing protein 3 isoform X2 [Oryzias melastigma]